MSRAFFFFVQSIVWQRPEVQQRCFRSIALHNTSGSTLALLLSLPQALTWCGAKREWQRYRRDKGLDSCFPYCHNQYYTNICSTDEPVHFSPEGSGLGKFGSDKAEQGSEEMWEQCRQSSQMGVQLLHVLWAQLGLTAPRTTSLQGLWVITSCNPWWKLDRSKPYLDPLDSSRH